MKIPRLYIDTSVLGGCFDTEFAPWSNRLFTDVRSGLFVPVLSEIVAIEIQNLERGYKPIQIFSPREVVSYDNEA